MKLEGMMSLSDCKIEYKAFAVLHECVAAGPMMSGVQFFRGEPIAEGTLAGMIKMGMALPPHSPSPYRHLTARLAADGPQGCLSPLTLPPPSCNLSGSPCVRSLSGPASGARRCRVQSQAPAPLPLWPCWAKPHIIMNDSGMER